MSVAGFGKTIVWVALIVIALTVFSSISRGETSYSSMGRENDFFEGYIHHKLFDEDFSDMSIYSSWSDQWSDGFPQKNANSITFDTTDEELCYLVSKEINYHDEGLRSDFPLLEIQIKFTILDDGKQFSLFNDGRVKIYYGLNDDEKIYYVYDDEGVVKDQLFIGIQQGRWYILYIYLNEDSFDVKLYDTQVDGSETKTDLYYFSDDLGISRFYIGDRGPTAYGNCEFDYIKIYGLPDEAFFEDFNDNNLNNWRNCQFDEGSIIRIKNKALYIKSSETENHHRAYIESPRIDIDFEEDYKVTFDLCLESVTDHDKIYVFRNRQICLYIKTNDQGETGLYYQGGSSPESERLLLNDLSEGFWWHFGIYVDSNEETYACYFLDDEVYWLAEDIPFEDYNTYWPYFIVGSYSYLYRCNGLFIDNIRIKGTLPDDTDSDGLSDDFEQGFLEGTDTTFNILAFTEDFETNIDIEEYGWRFSNPTDPYWEVGEPTETGNDPSYGVLFSGISEALDGNVLGTLIDGQYNESEKVRKMFSPSIDLTNALNGTLSFYQWYHFQPGSDGGRILISTDGGDTYTLLDDNQDPSFYSYDHVNAFNSGKGFSGLANIWHMKTVSLSNYVGNEIILCFEFATDDDGVYYWGWYIDNIHIYVQIDHENSNVDEDEYSFGGITYELLDGEEYYFYGTSCILLDTDKDAIPDVPELVNVYLSQLISYSDKFSNLNNRQADPLKKDIFYEIDWFKGCCNYDDGECDSWFEDPLMYYDSHQPIPGSLIQIQDSFLNHGIFVHFYIDEPIIVAPTEDGVDGKLIYYDDFPTYYSNYFDNVDNYYRYILIACLLGDEDIYLVDPPNAEIHSTMGITGIRSGTEFNFPEKYCILFDSAIDDEFDWWAPFIPVFNGYNDGVDPEVQFAGTMQHEMGHTFGMHHWSRSASAMFYTEANDDNSFPDRVSMEMGRFTDQEQDFTNYLGENSDRWYNYYYTSSGATGASVTMKLGGWELSVSDDRPSTIIWHGLYFGNGDQGGIGVYP